MPRPKPIVARRNTKTDLVRFGEHQTEAREGGFFARATYRPKSCFRSKCHCKEPRQGTNSVVAASSRARTSLGRPPRAAARALPYSEPNGTLRSAASLWTVRRVFRSGSADGVAWARGITLGSGGGGGASALPTGGAKSPLAPHTSNKASHVAVATRGARYDATSGCGRRHASVALPTMIRTSRGHSRRNITRLLPPRRPRQQDQGRRPGAKATYYAMYYFT